MTFPAVPVTMEDDESYPLHSEDDVAEIPDHRQQNTDLETAVKFHRPDAFVTGNACVYWEEGNRDRYVAPDVFVVPNWKPPGRLRTYRLWEHPPIVFIAETLSIYDFKPRQESMEQDYATHLHVPEYLSFHMERKELKLRVLGPHGYEDVAPEPSGHLRSQQLQLDFAMDESGFVRAYTFEGVKLPNAEELKQQLADEAQRREAAEARAIDEARARTREARRRREAEKRAAEEARLRESEAQLRQEAEARADEEARRRQSEVHLRQEAEARADDEARLRAELEREIAALRMRLGEP